MNNASLLLDKGVDAVDGKVGTVHDLYFDENTWTVRYMVVDTGKWLSGRKVLVAPEAIVKPWHHQPEIAIKLTTEQIRSGPDLDATMPMVDQKLRSANELAGYHVQAADGEVGEVDDLLLDDELSRILFLVVEVKGVLFGKKVLAGPSLISRVDGEAFTVHVDGNRQALKNSQEYNPAA